MSVQTIRAVANPANGPYVAESTAFRRKVKIVKQGEPDGKSRLPPKEEPKTSKKQIASPKNKLPSNPKYAATNSSKSPRPEMSLKTGTNNPDMRDERMDPELPPTNKTVQCMLLKEVRIVCASVKDIPSQIVDMCTCSPKEDTISPGEAEDVSEAIVESIEEPAEKDVAAPVAVQEETMAEETPAEEVPIEEEPTEEIFIEEIPTEEIPTEEAPMVEEPREEIFIEEIPMEETPMEEVPTEEAPMEEIPTEEAPIEEIPAEKAPTEEAPIEEIPAEEAPMAEALPEVTVSEVPEITEPDDSAVGVPEPSVEEVEEEEAPPSTITAIPDLDEVDPTAPIEISREFDGKKTNVSVQMQTSNTILTQILSEFQVGNKKRQILMSIKVHSNLEGCDAEEQPGNNPSSSNEVTSPRRQPSTRDGYDHRRRMRRPPESACTHRRALTARDVHNSSMNPTLISRASYQRIQRTYLRRLYDTFIYTSDEIDRDLCGPCGKRKR